MEHQHAYSAVHTKYLTDHFDMLLVCPCGESITRRQLILPVEGKNPTSTVSANIEYKTK